MPEWGYRYIDTPGVCGPVGEETARHQAARDHSVQVVYRESREGPWQDVDSPGPDGGEETDHA